MAPLTMTKAQLEPFLKIAIILGLKVTNEQLKEAGIQSGILDEVDYLNEDCRRRCEQLILEPDKVKPMDCKDAFLFLKDKYQEQH